MYWINIGGWGGREGRKERREGGRKGGRKEEQPFRPSISIFHSFLIGRVTQQVSSPLWGLFFYLKKGGLLT
jgi:hypothetical protein